jgi:hypothetical protein
VPEQVSARPGDWLRQAADLVQGHAEDDVVLRAVAATSAAGEDHSCGLMAVSVFLSKFIAEAAEGAGEDMGPVLARWRAAADRMDIASGEAPSPN